MDGPAKARSPCALDRIRRILNGHPRGFGVLQRPYPPPADPLMGHNILNEYVFFQVFAQRIPLGKAFEAAIFCQHVQFFAGLWGFRLTSRASSAKEKEPVGTLSRGKTPWLRSPSVSS